MIFVDIYYLKITLSGNECKKVIRQKVFTTIFLMENHARFRYDMMLSSFMTNFTYEDSVTNFNQYVE